MSNLEPQYNLLVETQSFYVLEVLSLALEGEQFLARGTLKRDVVEMRARHTTNFANALFDYLCLATWGEARHASDKCAFAIPELPYTSGRTAAQKMALEYNPRQFLPVLCELFEAKWSGGSYGGRSWVKIAEAATFYGDWPDTVFIDHCIDLAHNGGPCWDKNVIFTFDKVDTFTVFLTCKSASNIAEWGVLYLPPVISMLLERGYVLELLPGDTPVVRAREYPTLAMGYEPVVWGTKKVSELVPVYGYRDEDEYEYDDDYYEEPSEEDYGQEAQEEAQVKTVTLPTPRQEG